MKMFFTPPDQVGLRYQFLPVFPMPHDPRLDPRWTLPPVSDEDPLLVKHLSHHTILTDDINACPLHAGTGRHRPL